MDVLTVSKICNLAKLELSDAETAKVALEFSALLDRFGVLEKLDTSGVEPLLTPFESEVFPRPDEVQVRVSSHEILACAPQTVGNLVAVPPAIGE